MELKLLYLLIFVVAAIYSSVGHGGASGYLALLTFTSYSAKEISEIALVLNILVSGLAFISYSKAGHFNFKFSIPFVLGSVPAAFIGGGLHVSDKSYFLCLAIILFLIAVLMLLYSPKINNEIRNINYKIAVTSGVIIGFVSGVIGIGGGVFLSPLIILLKWADPKTTSATAAFFILLNSLSALFGRSLSFELSVMQFVPFITFAFIGGIIGSYFGANVFSKNVLRKFVVITLVIAAVKSFMKVM